VPRRALLPGGRRPEAQGHRQRGPRAGQKPLFKIRAIRRAQPFRRGRSGKACLSPGPHSGRKGLPGLIEQVGSRAPLRRRSGAATRAEKDNTSGSTVSGGLVNPMIDIPQDLSRTPSLPRPPSDNPGGNGACSLHPRGSPPPGHWGFLRTELLPCPILGEHHIQPEGDLIPPLKFPYSFGWVHTKNGQSLQMLNPG